MADIAEQYFSLPAGTRVEEYELVSVIGHGSFGITYLAEDTNLGTRLAIKEYLPQRLGDPRQHADRAGEEHRPQRHPRARQASLPERGAHPRARDASQHRQRAALLPGLRHGLYRDGLHRRAEPGRYSRPRLPGGRLSKRAGQAADGLGSRRAECAARGGDHSSRSEAREYPDRAQRQSDPGRFRSGTKFSALAAARHDRDHDARLCAHRAILGRGRAGALYRHLRRGRTRLSRHYRAGSRGALQAIGALELRACQHGRSREISGRVVDGDRLGARRATARSSAIGGGAVDGARVGSRTTQRPRASSPQLPQTRRRD